MPKGTQVAHKFGQDNGIMADGGIVFAPHPYVVVIMSEEIWGSDAAKVFPEISKMVYSNNE